jgi:hypothetical protein
MDMIAISGVVVGLTLIVVGFGIAGHVAIRA